MNSAPYVHDEKSTVGVQNKFSLEYQQSKTYRHKRLTWLLIKVRVLFATMALRW